MVRAGLEALPAIVRVEGERASGRFIEFFTATIRNRNTRLAYARAAKQFFDWCDDPPAETSGYRGHAHTTARSLARLYGAVTRGGEVDGYRIVRPEAIERFWAEQSFGADQVLMQLPTRFSMGFMLSQPGMGFGPNIKAFGRSGAGGSLGFADPVKRIGFGYTMNQMANGLLIDPRASALFDAFCAAL